MDIEMNSDTVDAEIERHASVIRERLEPMGQDATVVDRALEQGALQGYPPEVRFERARAILNTVRALYDQEWPAWEYGAVEAHEPLDVAVTMICVDDSVQVRVDGTDRKLVSQYRQQMESGATFPPIVAFFDEENDVLWLSDGFHRLAASGGVTWPTVVYAGDREDARQYAAVCNARHGKPLTLDDKRAAIRRILLVQPALSSREVGRRVSVSHNTVERVRTEMAEEGEIVDSPTRIVERGGETYEIEAPIHDEDEDEGQDDGDGQLTSADSLDEATADDLSPSPFADEGAEPFDAEAASVFGVPPDKVLDDDAAATEAAHSGLTWYLVEGSPLAVWLTLQSSADSEALAASLHDILGSDTLSSAERAAAVDTLQQAILEYGRRTVSDSDQVCGECDGHMVRLYDEGGARLVCMTCGTYAAAE